MHASSCILIKNDTAKRLLQTMCPTVNTILPKLRELLFDSLFIQSITISPMIDKDVLAEAKGGSPKGFALNYVEYPGGNSTFLMT